jgi:ribosomal-protein-alanine N-acetyltransferase
MRVETACFPNPWAANTFLQELERAQAHIDVLRRQVDGLVVGFINHWVVLDELHLLNVATHPEERRRGHARQLIEHMLAFGRQTGCRVVLLEVRRSNEAALALYRRFGFRSVGVRPGYYSDNGEDAILMNLDLPEGP